MTVFGMFRIFVYLGPIGSHSTFMWLRMGLSDSRRTSAASSSPNFASRMIPRCVLATGKLPLSAALLARVA